uniref:Uncharacterized protein MANES_15G051900 n=1 Tax=Rhizophora mucronata TaxID=61149 RepID=A0A2P2L238_RHIMU
MSSSSFPLPPSSPFSIIRCRHSRHRTISPHLLSKPSLSLPHSLSLAKSYVCFCSSPYNPANDNSGEFFWLREEQRWLREEQRWIREEQRWLRERESLLAEIQSLKLRIQALEDRIPAQREIVLEERNRIVEGGSVASPIVLKLGEEKEVIGVLENKQEEEEKKKDNKRKPLRKGSEGEEVRELQVCSHFF